MTRTEWKRKVFAGLASELSVILDARAEWLFHDPIGAQIPWVEEVRMRSAVASIQEELRRRGGVTREQRR